jgi:hypothetical protein
MGVNHTAKGIWTPRPLGGQGSEDMSKQLDRIEEKLDELNKLVGSVAWYFEEAMDYLAVLDEEILLIEDKLGIESTRLGNVPRPPTLVEDKLDIESALHQGRNIK